MSTREQEMNEELSAGGLQVGARVRYSSDGKLGSPETLDCIGQIDSWNGGPAGYRVCMIVPEGTACTGRDHRVMRLENEIAAI